MHDGLNLQYFISTMVPNSFPPCPLIRLGWLFPIVPIGRYLLLRFQGLNCLANVKTSTIKMLSEGLGYHPLLKHLYWRARPNNHLVLALSQVCIFTPATCPYRHLIPFFSCPPGDPLGPMIPALRSTSSSTADPHGPGRPPMVILICHAHSLLPPPHLGPGLPASGLRLCLHVPTQTWNLHPAHRAQWTLLWNPEYV